MFKFRIITFLLTLAAIFALVPQSQAQIQQTEEKQQEEYSESALRRFEIVTLSALPFTAVHSYLGVRGFRMIQTNKIAPVITPKNYRAIGISAVSLSLFIGIWDWLHTRKVDRSAPSVPGRKPPSPPTEEGVPPDGSIVRVPSFAPHASMYGISTYPQQAQHGLNRWATEPAAAFVIPLLQIRF